MLGRSLAMTATVLALASCATPSVPLTRPPESTASEFAPPTARSTPPADVAVPAAEAGAPPAERDPGAVPSPKVADRVTDDALQARLAARALAFLGRRGPFRAAGERFSGDCSGFVEAVYAAEGLALRELVKQEAPTERSAVKAAWIAAQRHGRTFGAGETPVAGDLVFWHDTYDRNRNRKADDRFTHVGIVERVEDGTVQFLHRGRRGVVRGVMTLDRSHEESAPDGHRLNSRLRERSHPVKYGGLAGELFAGYARLDAPLARQGAVAERSTTSTR